jgi:hypothetical protein
MRLRVFTKEYTQHRKQSDSAAFYYNVATLTLSQYCMFCNVISRYNSAVWVGAQEGSWILYLDNLRVARSKCPSTPRKQQGGGSIRNIIAANSPSGILKMLSFWISFCELYFLLCSLTSQPFAIATELPVNHTLSFVENLKNFKFLHARQNWTFTIKIIFIFSKRVWKNYTL